MNDLKVLHEAIKRILYNYPKDKPLVLWDKEELWDEYVHFPYGKADLNNER